MVQLFVKRNLTMMSTGATVGIRCPACKRFGTFNAIGGDLAFFTDDLEPAVTVGHRRCPNELCCAHVFVVTSQGKLLVTYPPERLDFDSRDIPKPITESLEEAISCHAAQCYMASAIMVRKTLENLCNELGATGPNLKERIKALSSKVVLPPELFSGLDDLRLLGNDAAHFEFKDFENVSQEEAEVAIEFAKEVLKAIYQYRTLLANLQRLKKSKNQAATAQP